MVAIVYARVSSEDQARTGFSLPSQVEAGRRRAKELGTDEVVVFTDEGVPGDVLERPGLQGALEAVRRGGVAIFICYDPDRLARSLSLQLLVTDQVERVGTRLEFVNFEYKNTPEGQLFYSLRGAISQFEKAKIRERTMRGKRQKARGGGLTHNPCIYGYDFDPVADSLTVNQDEARVVQMIFHWFIQEDMGPWSIAQRLTDMGIPPSRAGRSWHHSSVRNILRNESYTGTYFQQKWDYSDTRINKYRAKGEKVPRKIKPQEEWLPVTIQAIIDPHIYRAAQQKLENARRWWSGWHKEEYLLSGLCHCAICKRPIYGASRMSGQRRIRYYVCRGYAPGVPGQPRCAFARVRADDIEEAVWQEIRSWVLEPERLKQLMAQQVDQASVQEELDLLQKQIAEAEAEHERTVRLVVRGSIDQGLGDTLLKEQRQKLTRLRDHLARATAQATDAVVLEDHTRAVDELRRDLEPVIDDLPFEKRQTAVRALVKGIELSREETVILARLASFTAKR